MWQIIVTGQVVREFATREECIAVAVRQYWGILVAGKFTAAPGVQIVQKVEERADD